MADNRSLSRGRDFVSTGRGGGGNFVRSESVSRTRREDDGDERGRELFVPTDKVTHAGRGGQGNIRSPSRDANKEAADRAYEEEILRQRREQRAGQPVSSGRGGSGNISRSRSREPRTSESGVRTSIGNIFRSRSREPRASTESGVGRGGAGNIDEARHYPHLGQGELGKLDEEERIDALKHGGKVQVQINGHHLHSSGRGGEGNMTDLESYGPTTTKLAPPAPGVVSHGGRGGAGNIEV